MKVSIKNETMVKPAEPTWTGFLPLSDFDLVGTLAHVRIVSFYSPSPPADSAAAIFQAMKASLSETLVHLYPLAGRLFPLGRGRYQIDCNAAGVLMVLAEADVDCSTVVQVPDADLGGLVPWVDMRTTPHEEYPMMAVQVTRFACGGMGVGVALAHAAVDGISAAYVLRQWARIARGEPLEGVPFLDRTLLLNLGDGVNDCPPVEFQMAEDYFSAAAGDDFSSGTPVACSRATIIMTESLVELLRAKANKDQPPDDPKFSRFEAITAHIWRSACKAWQQPHGQQLDQDTRLGMSVDMRRHLSLPKSYLGNAVLDVVACSSSTELISNPLTYSARKLRETINKVDVDYLKSACAFLKAMDDLTCLQHEAVEDKHYPAQEGKSRMPMLLVTSWLTVKFEGNDFGWGNDVCTMPVEYGKEGECLIKNGTDETGRSVMVIVCLRETHVESFKKFFLEEI